MNRKQILNILLIFLILISIYPITITFNNTVKAALPGDYALVTSSTNYTDYGFTDHGIYYTSEALVHFNMPVIIERTGDWEFVNYSDLAYHLATEVGAYATRFQSFNYTVLDSNANYYIVCFNMTCTASNESMGVDFVPKIKGHSITEFGWWNSSWNYWVSITFDHDLVSSTLSNFPMKINISDSIGDMCDDGDSIRFVPITNDSTMFHEIEKFVDGSDRIVFVNLTELNATSDTQILMYYNNSGASDTSSPENVWDSNYVGVYHMSNASGDLVDSTGNRHGTPMGAGLPLSYQQSGLFGYSIDFNGNDEWVNITDSVYEFVDDWTVEAVVNCDVYDTKFRTAVYLGDDDFDPRYILYRNAKWESHEGFWSFTKNGAPFDRAKSNQEGDECTQGWFYLGAPHEQGVETFLNTNGVVTREEHDGISIDLASGGEFYADIGGHPTNNNYRWDGKLEEIRISNIVRSEAWLNATWHSFNTDALISFGNPINQSDVYPPGVFNATTIDTGQISLAWTTGDNATHTYIERNTLSSWMRETGTMIYNNTGTSYDDTYSGFSCGTRYYYQAWGYNSSAVSWSTDSTTINNITCPTNPSDIGTAIYTTALNITWTNDSFAETTVLVRKFNGYPTSVSDGTVLYNGTNEYYNDTSFNTSVNYRLYTWNGTVDEHSSGVNAPYGSFIIRAFDENTSLPISNWDVFITDQEGDNTYESLNNSNPLTIDVNDIPYGDDTIIIINSTGYSGPWYNSKVFVMDLEPNVPYTLNAYLSETNATELYFFYVVNILDEPVPDAQMNIKRYINDSVGYGNASILLTDASGQVSCYLVPDQIYLIVISKEGYESEESIYQPDPDYYGPYYPKTFQLLFSEPDIKFITIGDLHFNGTINSAGTIQIWYDDPFLQTMNTEIQIYEEYNGTLSWNHTDTRSSDNSFTFTDTGYNTSRRHKCILYVNHSNLDGYSEYIYFFIEPIRSTMSTQQLENYWTDVFGEWELGFIPTILVFLPALFLLVVFGAGHIGLGIMVTGMYLGFTTYMLDLSNAASLIAIGSMLAVSGFVLIIAKRGRKAV